MSSETALEQELLGRVRRLREDGMSVKQIARTLGKQPHFPDVADHLGSWHGDVAITFGMDGAPCYVAGPYDDAGSVIQRLTESVGEGNFTFLAPVGALH